MIVPGVVVVWTGLLSVSGEDIGIRSVFTVIIIFKTIYVIVVIVCSSSRTFFLGRGSVNIMKIYLSNVVLPHLFGGMLLSEIHRL